MTDFKNKAGNRYGRLLVLGNYDRRYSSGRSRIFWDCLCDCGKECSVVSDNLRSAGYESFLIDIGRAPTNIHSIERINVNGNYDPGNCKWATAKEQAQWSEFQGISYKYLHWQVKYKSRNIEDFINV